MNALAANHPQKPAKNLDAVRVLLEETDPIRRSAAHRDLAERAMAREDLIEARVHFREAADIDPTDEVSREVLKSLPQESTPSWWRRLLGRWKS